MKQDAELLARQLLHESRQLPDNDRKFLAARMIAETLPEISQYDLADAIAMDATASLGQMLPTLR